MAQIEGLKFNGLKFKVRAVMFDLDGTLIHTAPEIATAANLMLADLGRPMLPDAQVESYIGEGAVKLIKRCLTAQKGIEPDEALFNQAEPLFFAHYANHAVLSKPYDGVVDGLQAIWNKGLKLACVTNKPEEFTLPLLKTSGLADFFDMVVSGDTLHKKSQTLYSCITFVQNLMCLNTRQCWWVTPQRILRQRRRRVVL